MFIDTHCHLSKENYDIDKLINSCKNKNVDILIISGCDKNGITEGLEIIKRYSNIFMTIGFHPSEVEVTTDDDLKWLEDLVKNEPKIVGIGEIGLDYHWDKDHCKEQRELFEKQLIIAERLKKPIVIHSRDATKDTYDLLKKHQLHGIIHCFSGSLEMAKEYIKLGYYLGIGGVLTFKNSNLKNIVSNISLENITLETDSPYLTPEPYRGTTNSPEYIPLIANKIAEIKDTSVDEVATFTSNNAISVFNLSK